MKKFILAALAMFAASSAFAQSGGSAGSGAGGSAYTVGGVLTANDAGSQTITVSQKSTAVPFESFPMTISKGVSLASEEDTSAEAQLLVLSKHLNSKKHYGGRTGGGSITECTAASLKDAAIGADATAPTSSLVSPTTGGC